MSVSDLPAINACFNTLSTVFLTLGFVFIRKGLRRAHRNCMIIALCSSTLFLAGYLSYHFSQPGVTRFPENWFKPVYLAILLTHTVLAAAILPMVIITVLFAIRGKYESHKKIARWTWPTWLYVSITGVVIYLLLYQVFPQQAER